MSEKIESIELEAFRVYKDKKIFNFNKDGEVANLVIIYAPNGSGKTTLFDSIEWAFTGSISRISDNNQVHDIAVKQKGKILRNVDSSLENGLVKVNLTNKDYIEMKTKKLDGRQKTDYRPGDANATGIFKSEISKKRFVEKNILKHHQIDKFLRFQNSKERYQALSIFWDSNKESEKYISLVLFINEIEKFYKKLQLNIQKTKEEIKDLSLSPNVIKDLEKQILEYNSYQNEKILLFDNNDYKELYDNSSKFKVEKELLYLKKYNNLNEMEQFYTNYIENYPKFQIKFNEIEQELMLDRKMLENFTIKQTLKADLNILNDENIKITEQIEREKYLEKNKDFIEEIDVKRYTLLNSLSDYEKKKLELEKLNSTILNDIQVNEKELILLKETFEEKNRNQKKLNESRKIIDIEINLNKYNSLIEENEVEINRIEIERNSLMIEEKILLELSKLNLDNLIEEPYYFKKLPLELKGYYQILLNQVNDQKNINKEIKLLESEISSYVQIGNDLEKIKKLGMDLILKTESEICPVCNSKFKTYEDLINKIQSNLHNSEHLEQLSEKVSRLKKSSKKYKDTITEVLGDITKEVNIKIDKNTKDIYIADVMLSNLKKKLQENRSKALELSDSKEAILKILNDLILKDFKIEFSLINIENELKGKEEEIKSNIQLISLKMKEREEVLNKEKQRLDNNEAEIRIISSQISIIQAEINQLINNESYIKYKNILIEKSFSEVNLQQLEGQKFNVITGIFHIEKKLNQLEDIIKDINEEDLNLKYQKLIREKENLTKLLISLTLKCKEYIGKDSFDEEIYFVNRNKLSDEVEILTKQLENLSFIITNLGSYLENHLILEKKEMLKKLENDSSKTRLKLKNLKELKNKSYIHIKTKIQKVFNEESINEIFRMIDPLKEKSKISFEIDELSEGLLGMDVLYSDEKKKEGKSPILYLSSAQVNILSLSIFLASAIEHIDYIKTILMDDPLQHLDGLNILSFIDLIRIISFSLDIQIIISTHNQNFFDLCKRKIDSRYYQARYIDLSPKIE